MLAQPAMPGAQWFVGAQVNYAQQVLRHVDAADAAGIPAIISHNEASLAAGDLRDADLASTARPGGQLALHVRRVCNRATAWRPIAQCA